MIHFTKAIVYVLIILACTTTAFAYVNATHVWCPADGIVGDTNSNGAVTTLDITYMNLILNGNRTFIGNFNQCIDSDGNGTFQSYDTNVTRWYILGENTSQWPVGSHYDIAAPQIDYITPPTSVNGSTVNYSIQANVSFIDNYDMLNITFKLYNSTGLYNYSMFTVPSLSSYGVTWTNVSPGNYSFHVIAQDSAGNTNITQTRYVTVVWP